MLKQQWATLRFGEVTVQTTAAQHIFEAEVYLNDLDPKAVRVELYADGINGSDPIRPGDDARPAIGLRIARGDVSCIGLGGPLRKGLWPRIIRTAPVWRCLWKSLPFSGSGDATSNGRRTREDGL